MNTEKTLNEILQEFYRIAKVPRPSHHEEKISAYLVQWANTRGLSVFQDSLGDVIIDKPACRGCEQAPKVILQAHMDMVCIAAEGVKYDPLSDPIDVVVQGDSLRARGTSLGADDGIGVALCLQLLQSSTIHHGPLRVIFTVNEEDGMDSIDMPSELLDGDFLINLDWESLGSLCNSAAGCDFIQFVRDGTLEPAPAGQISLKLTMKGLLGGHSGVSIDLGRANALVCMAALLLRLQEQGITFRLSDFTGGQARNAIPAAAQAEITLPEAQYEQAAAVIDTYKRDFLDAFGAIETASEFVVETGSSVTHVLDEKSTNGLLALLVSLPNGVNTMSPFVKGLVESSQNLGVLSIQDGHIQLEAMERSCVNYRAEELLRAARTIAGFFEFDYVQGDHAPAWAVNPNSRLVPIACAAYRKLTGNEMIVEPVHGGLECGAFFEKNPRLDMIAIGPTLKDVHTPDESCDIESIRVTYELLVEILLQLSKI